MLLLFREPQIIIESDGLRTAGTPFYKWSKITNEKMIREGRGENMASIIYVMTIQWKHKFHLKDLENYIGLQQIFAASPISK